jgi:hypothetical protein
MVSSLSDALEKSNLKNAKSSCIHKFGKVLRLGITPRNEISDSPRN